MTDQAGKNASSYMQRACAHRVNWRGEVVVQNYSDWMQGACAHWVKWRGASSYASTYWWNEYNGIFGAKI